MKVLRTSLTTYLLAGLLAQIATAQVPDTLLHSLYPPGTNSLAGAQHGYSVAIDGSIVVVGAPYAGMNATASGTAAVYDATTGALMHSLVNPNSAAYGFGWAVAVSGARIVVGVPDSTGANVAGSAYVYDLDSLMPTMPVLTVTNPRPAAMGYFGWAVAISGPRMVVGAAWDLSDGYDRGRAYVYDLTSAWPREPIVTLTNSIPLNQDIGFGASVAISGTRVVIGAPHHDTGKAFVYDLSSPAPALPLVTLTNPGPYPGSLLFGHSVSMSGTRIAVGVPSHSVVADGAGIAHVYDLATGTPTEPVNTLTNPSPAASDGYGFAVAISGTRVVVGAMQDSIGATNAGSAYVYELANAMPTIPIATLTNPSPARWDYFGGAVALAGTTVVVGAYGDDLVETDSGLAYIFGPRPTLNIAPAGQGVAQISWTPATSSGFVLQSKSSIPSGNWVNAPSGANNPVLIPVTNAARFYRLAQP